MKRKSYALLASILLVALALGCATSGGFKSLRVVDSSEMTVQTLINNWQDYNIYWAGLDPTNTAAVLFDPKNDGKTLKVGDRWGQVGDQNTLNKMIGMESVFHGFNPKLRAVVGPDGSTFGYVYTVLEYLGINVVDDKTIFVESLS